MRKIGIYTENGFEEIEVPNEPIVVPQKVTAIQFLSALAFAGISEAQITQVIQSLPEPHKTIALIAFKRATIFERDNEFIAMLQGYFNLSNTDVDNLFINANNIEI